MQQASTFISGIFGRSDGSTAPITPTNPAAPVIEDKPAPPPMDSWKDLWQPVDTSKDGPDTTLPENLFAGVDPAKMLEAARKVDFAKSIPPEVLVKIAAGGPQAQEAFVTAMNDIGQRAYAQSSFASTKMIEAALKKYQEGVEKRLPSTIRAHSIADTIKQNNPAFSNPAAAPIVEALQSQLTVKFPNATATEINDMAKQYLTQFAALVAPPPVKVDPTVKASEDWDKFLSGN
jgi:hypothetical protein